MATDPRTRPHADTVGSPLTPELPELRAGVYRHHSGHLYLVLGYAHDSTNSVDGDGRTVVVYIGLDLDGAKNGQRMLVREVNEFLGFTPSDAGIVPRFKYVGPTLDLPGEPPAGESPPGYSGN